MMGAMPCIPGSSIEEPPVLQLRAALLRQHEVQTPTEHSICAGAGDRAAQEVVMYIILICWSASVADLFSQDTPASAFTKVSN